MYKTLLHFSGIVIIVAILFSLYILFYFSNQYNTILVEPNEYVNILEQVHNNIDNYLGKKIIISGYVYIQEDFSQNRFVIAQNVYVNQCDEPIIIGFLCENTTNIPLMPDETVKIEGIIDKCIYNNTEYPIIKAHLFL